jgi:hypothetical protein
LKLEYVLVLLVLLKIGVAEPLEKLPTVTLPTAEPKLFPLLITQ